MQIQIYGRLPATAARRCIYGVLIMAHKYMVKPHDYIEGKSSWMPNMFKPTDERIAKRDRQIEDLKKTVKEKEDESRESTLALLKELEKSRKLIDDKVHLLDQNSVLRKEIERLKIALDKYHTRGPPPAYDPNARPYIPDASTLDRDAEGE
jgi:hypothetical protein